MNDDSVVVIILTKYPLHRRFYIGEKEVRFVVNLRFYFVRVNPRMLGYKKKMTRLHICCKIKNRPFPY